MTNIIDIIIEVFSCVFNSFSALWFVSFFSGAKLRVNRRFSVFAAVLFLINLISNFLLRTCLHYVLYLIAFYVLSLIALTIYSFSSYKSLSIERKLLPVFSYFALFIITNIVSSFIASIAMHHTISSVYSGFHSGRTVFLLINATLVTLFIIFAVLLYKKSVKHKHTSQIYNIFLFLPLISAFVAFSYPYLFEFENLTHIFDIYYILTVFITLLSAVGMYYLIYRMWLKNKAEKEKELYENMLKMEAKRYDDIKNSSKQIRKIRHDIKNMLFSVKAEIDENNIAKAQRSLDDILDNVNSIGLVIESGNRTIDYIVNAKLGNLEDKTITVSGNASGMSKLKNVDISIILGNILDNAAQATENIDDAVIELSFFIKGNYQNILCKNTINSSVLQKNPELFTEKSEKDSHGFGIKSVKEIADFYNGTVDIFEENNMFCVHIMIPIQ